MCNVCYGNIWAPVYQSCRYHQLPDTKLNKNLGLRRIISTIIRIDYSLGLVLSRKIIAKENCEGGGVTIILIVQTVMIGYVIKF